MSSRAATSWRRSPALGAPARPVRADAAAWRVRNHAGLGGLAQLDNLARIIQLVPLGVSFVTTPRTPPAHFPSRRVVAARRAPHHHPLTLEMQDRVMTA